MALMVENLLANKGDLRDTGSIPALGRSPGIGNGSPFPYSCVEKPLNRGTRRAFGLWVAKGQTQLKQFSS